MCIHCCWQAGTSRSAPSRQKVRRIFVHPKRETYFLALSRMTSEYSRVMSAGVSLSVSCLQLYGLLVLRTRRPSAPHLDVPARELTFARGNVRGSRVRDRRQNIRSGDSQAESMDIRAPTCELLPALPSFFRAAPPFCLLSLPSMRLTLHTDIGRQYT